ncbi:hypothetical protein EYF80_020605 [Liparis tanakae]|uniref:Uncharacterized protein n=1 Tax=Liparis tanakae TaxID=230148 RepID=A0A4Z2HTQ7_9TELE|nr:hypothetical protein EYF80_020605 [Liparis tanakae]
MRNVFAILLADRLFMDVPSAQSEQASTSRIPVRRVRVIREIQLTWSAPINNKHAWVPADEKRLGAPADGFVFLLSPVTKKQN